MNRAERRRQMKLAKKAARNEKLVKATNRSPRQQTLAIQQSLDLAVQHHTAGRFPEAERIIQQILQADPRQPVALHLLGLVAFQVGKYDVSVDLITKSLAIEPDNAEAHSNLGVALQNLGKLDEAVDSCHKALAIKPDFAVAHDNLGSALRDLGKVVEGRGKLPQGPHYSSPISPRHITTWETRSGTWGKWMRPSHVNDAQFPLNPRTTCSGPVWRDFLEAHSFTSVDDNLWQDLLHLLERPTVHPSSVVRPIIRALRLHPDFSQILEVTGSGNPVLGISYVDMAEQLSAIPLFSKAHGTKPHP